MVVVVSGAALAETDVVAVAVVPDPDASCRQDFSGGKYSGWKI